MGLHACQARSHYREYVSLLSGTSNPSWLDRNFHNAVLSSEYWKRQNTSGGSEHGFLET